jgi:hypothetical protein
MLIRIVLQKDQHEKALAVLMRIHTNTKDPSGTFAKAEYDIMREQFLLEHTNGLNAYKEMFTKPHNRKRLALGFGIMFGGQCTGTLVINCKFGLLSPYFHHI